MEKPKVLEARINSIQDAQSAIQNSIKIAMQFRKGNYQLLELTIAQEIKDKVMPLLAGVFQVKTNYRFIKPKAGTSLYLLPPFKER